MTLNNKILKDLVDIQTNNFKVFLKKSLKLEMAKFSFINSSELDLFIDVNKLKYKKPLFSVDFCLSYNKTYAIPIYVPIKLKYNNSLILNKYVFLGELPLLTDRGCFIINGNFRVLVNQIVRSPGIYYESFSEDKTFSATIVPYRGSWITLKMDF